MLRMSLHDVPHCQELSQIEFVRISIRQEQVEVLQVSPYLLLQEVREDRPVDAVETSD